MSFLTPEVRVRNANERNLAEFINDTFFKMQGAIVEVSVVSRKNLPNNIADEAFKLVEENMQEMYEKSSWGWDRQKKLVELTDDSARFLLVIEADSKQLVAFAHFRFEMECSQAVLYCYELQVSSRFQRAGLGGYILKCMELIALKAQMDKIMLTVFPHNEAGVSFYTRKMRFHIDETSPWQLGESGAKYYILSLELQKSVF